MSKKSKLKEAKKPGSPAKAARLQVVARKRSKNAVAKKAAAKKRGK